MLRVVHFGKFDPEQNVTKRQVEQFILSHCFWPAQFLSQQFYWRF